MLKNDCESDTRKEKKQQHADYCDKVFCVFDASCFVFIGLEPIITIHMYCTIYFSYTNILLMHIMFMLFLGKWLIAS